MSGIRAVSAIKNEYGNWDYDWIEMTEQEMKEIIDAFKGATVYEG